MMTMRLPIKIVPATTFVQKVENKELKKKILWGEPFWNLFHVLAEKVKPESFPIIRVPLLQLIFTICSNLPCPDCCKHAVAYLTSIQYQNIQTKEQLKTMFFDFHNSVNARKKVDLYSRTALDEKYSRGLLGPILGVFLVHFQQKNKSIRMIADDLFKGRIAVQISNWFQANMDHFNYHG